MHPDPNRQSGRSPHPLRHGVLVLSGRQIRLTVAHGRLHATDTLSRDARSSSYSRATCPLKRVVITGTGGYLSLDAIEWLSDLKIPLLQLHPSGRILLSSGHRGLDDARLRRCQAQTTPHSPLGLTLARQLLAQKLAGQAALLPRLPGGAIAEPLIATERAAHDTAASVDELRLAEARAAAAYWHAWNGLPVTFTTRDSKIVPPHWLTFTTRSSPLTGSPRLAGDPANAILNYLYSLAESEARLAAIAVGLDPAMGFLHLDAPNRDSLAADLQEPLRPHVDAYALDLFESHVFTRRDFHETRRGQVRLLPPLAHHLAATLPTWADRVAPIAEGLAGALAGSADLRSLPTNLTGRRRRNAHPRTKRPVPAQVSAPPPPTRCEDCGREITRGQRRCATCHAQRNADRMRAYQAAETARRQVASIHPVHREDVRDRIATTQRAQWERRKDAAPPSGYTRSDFHRLILPRLAALTAGQIAAATGLSRPYAAKIRAGQRVPHTRHWPELHAAALRVRAEPPGLNGQETVSSGSSEGFSNQPPSIPASFPRRSRPHR